MSKYRVISLCILMSLCSSVLAQTDSTSTVPKQNVFQKIINYFATSNETKPSKKFDFGIIGGPYYSQDTNIGIGLVASGIYKRNPADTINPATQFSIYGDISITGYYKIGIDGSSYFNTDKIWLYYDLHFLSRPDRYWGIGYAMNSDNANEVKYKRWAARLNTALLFQLFDPDLYLGPVIQLDYIDAKSQPDPKLWRYQKRRTFSDVFGFGIVYDSRDNVYNAFKGIYARIDQLFAPKFLGNQYAFSLTEATFNSYHQVWKGGVIATNLHARFTYDNTPWGMMSEIGGSNSMRGYWEGRYNDKCAADVQVELRQHLFWRFGMAIWGGVGEVFPKINQIFKGHALWNAGLGIRWEFKKRVNIRIDYGFGQRQNGLVFSINEAF